MAKYKVEQLRNVALLGHGSSGKTSLSEALIYDSGGVSRMGRVENGSTVSDWDPEEQRRGFSVNTSIIPCEWQGHKINILDTPGYMDFIGEVIGAVRVADAAIIVLDAVSGVEVGTEAVWAHADERKLPRFAFINKMDRENASFDGVLAQLREAFSGNFVPLQLPIGAEASFRGVVDLVEKKAYIGPEGEATEIPAEMAEAVEEARVQLIEAAAESDDELIMKYLEGEELTPDEIRRGLSVGVRDGSVIPVLCGSATQNLGVHALLKAIIDFLPSPLEAPKEVATVPGSEEEVELSPDPNGPLAVLAFKTVADPYVGKLTYFRVVSGTLRSDSRVFNPRVGQEERIGQLFMVRGKEQTGVEEVIAGDLGAVAKLTHTLTGDTLCDQGTPLVLKGMTYPHPLYEVAVSPKTKADSAKMGTALTRLCEEDPTLQWRQEKATRETILAGLGEAHIDVAVRRLESKFGVGVETSIPKVPYRETISRVASAQYRHKKQTGGAGQFAEVHLRVEPLERGAGFEYVNEVFGGAISSAFIPSIEKGIRQVMEQGVIAGYPVVDIKAAVYDGKEHPVDSKDIAFQIAGREVFKLAVQQAGPILLEPIMNVTITVPEQYMGDVLSDLNTKRARVQGMEQVRGKSIIRAQVPLAEMQRYATDLRSLTQGRGIYTMEFSHYEPVPSHIAERIIAEAKQRANEEK
ncbi:MAG TPA: elongation factor G [Caldilineae bacterium]|nr:elongation factor G [Caldilineae bacterium]